MNEGFHFIKRFEGIHDGDLRTPLLEPERDPVGIWTLGWGATRDIEGKVVTESTRAIDHAEADELLARDFNRAVEAAHRLAEPVKLKFNEVIALGSFIYNLGPMAFYRSDLRKYLLAGDYGRVPLGFCNWVSAGGKSLRGLGARRAAEADLFMNGFRR